MSQTTARVCLEPSLMRFLSDILSNAWDTFKKMLLSLKFEVIGLRTQLKKKKQH